MDNEQDYNPEYPLGGMIEPYDIEREKDMLFEDEQAN